jgi:two-component SAPR family response regulator
MANNEIDLLLLDVEMPLIGGIEFIKSLKQPHPIIVLTTSFKEYAIEAFDNNVTDYLVKPIALPRFMQAMAKAKDLYEKNNIHHVDETSVFIKKGYIMGGESWRLCYPQYPQGKNRCSFYYAGD